MGIYAVEILSVIGTAKFCLFKIRYFVSFVIQCPVVNEQINTKQSKLISLGPYKIVCTYFIISHLLPLDILWGPSTGHLTFFSFAFSTYLSELVVFICISLTLR